MKCSMTQKGKMALRGQLGTVHRVKDYMKELWGPSTYFLLATEALFPRFCEGDIPSCISPTGSMMVRLPRLPAQAGAHVGTRLRMQSLWTPTASVWQSPFCSPSTQEPEPLHVLKVSCLCHHPHHQFLTAAPPATPRGLPFACPETPDQVQTSKLLS